MKFPGKIITNSAIVPVGGWPGSASGIWTLDEAIYYNQAGTWPTLLGVEDIFSAYTYTGNASTQTITTGVNLSWLGGLVWIKDRSATNSPQLIDTINGVSSELCTDGTSGSYSASTVLSSFNSDGFTLTNWGGGNNNTDNFISWSFAQSPKFFKIAQATVSGGVTATVDLSSLGTVGMVTVKRTDSTSAWFTYHRSCTTGKLVYFNTTAAETTDGSITLSGTTLSLVGGTIANGTYIIYAWAHDTSSTGMIQCGEFTSDGSGGCSVNLGWEPQLLLIKPKSSVYGWSLFDTARGFCHAASGDKQLYLNTNAVEDVFDVSTEVLYPTATGFAGTTGLGVTQTRIYLAIRRGPMKFPTVGTQVYNAIAVTSDATNNRIITGVGFPPDSVWEMTRNSAGNQGHIGSRLIGGTAFLYPASTSAEVANNNYIASYNMDGFTEGSSAGSTGVNYTGETQIFWNLRRYPGVFDEVCHTGTGANKTEPHNLGVVPELMINKGRAGFVSDWYMYDKDIGATNIVYLNWTDASAADATTWNNTAPTASVVTFGSRSQTNGVGLNFVCYLFATRSGISKVGSYTGNGSSLTLDMGFTTGARFFMCKRTDSTGDWFVWDSTRGINAGNDPHLSLNTTAAEVNTTDDVDSDNSGIIVNENATTHINVNNATYIYLSFS